MWVSRCFYAYWVIAFSTSTSCILPRGIRNCLKPWFTPLLSDYDWTWLLNCNNYNGGLKEPRVPLDLLPTSARILLRLEELPHTWNHTVLSTVSEDHCGRETDLNLQILVQACMENELATSTWILNQIPATILTGKPSSGVGFPTPACTAWP